MNPTPFLSGLTIALDDTPSAARSTPATHTLQSDAFKLYDAGLNVFPVPPASKAPYGRHGFLTAARLHRPDLPALMADSNVAVMTGRLSQNLFVLDCDAHEAFHQVGTELEAHGIQAWIRSSVRGGQYWLLCAAGEVANGKVGKVDILGNRTYALAPPSVHPSGMVYQWEQREGDLPPLVTLEQLAFLPLRLQHKERRPQHEKRETVLPLVAHAVLITQNASRYAGDHSAAEYAACLSLLGAGYTESDVLRLFQTFQPPHYAKVGAADFRRAVLIKAQAYRAQSGGQSSSASHSSVFAAWANAAAWPGRAGHTNKAVFLALCHRMQCEGGQVFRASIREIAELANVHVETAHKSVQRLIVAGRVHFVNIDRLTGANRYTLPLPEPVDNENKNRTLLPTRDVGQPTVRSLFPDHDAWNARALGKSCLFVYRILRADSPLQAKDIAAVTGKAPQTIRRALKVLASHGLARPDGTRWASVATTAEALDRLAMHYGTLGKSDLRAEQHQAQREKRASALVRLQKRRWEAGGRLSA